MAEVFLTMLSAGSLERLPAHAIRLAPASYPGIFVHQGRRRTREGVSALAECIARARALRRSA